jgi:hypothetical protein
MHIEAQGSCFGSLKISEVLEIMVENLAFVLHWNGIYKVIPKLPSNTGKLAIVEQLELQTGLILIPTQPSITPKLNRSELPLNRLQASVDF